MRTLLLALLALSLATVAIAATPAASACGGSLEDSLHCLERVTDALLRHIQCRVDPAYC